MATFVNASPGTTITNTATIEGVDPDTGNNTDTGTLGLPDTGGLSPTGADLQLLLVALGLVGVGLLALGASRRRAPGQD